MTYSVNIATHEEAKMDLFPSYIPSYKSIDLASNKYLFEEYLDTDTIGELIIKIKKNNNLTLKDISNITGFSITHISNVINGKKASTNLINHVYKLKHNLRKLKQ